MKTLQKAYENRAKKLNKIEKLKQTKDPFMAWQKLEYYAKNGYDSIPDEDKSYFLKCFGIYDRPKTPKQFMLKLRIPAGHLDGSQAMVIAQSAKKYRKDYLDLTTRAQCELRYLDIENLPTILKELEATGIVAHQTGVDNVRGIMGDPFDELAFDNILPSHAILLKMQEEVLFKQEWVSQLPRKFNVAITGCMSNRCNVFVHDLCFVLANKDGVYGYNVYLGGKVGVIAKNADLFVRNEAEVIACFKAVISLYKKFGFRDNRNKNRLSFLIEAVGIETFSNAIRKEAGIEFASAGITLTNTDYFEPDSGKVQLRDGTYAVHVVVPSGIFSGSALEEVVALSQKYANAQLRIDMEQSLYIMGVKDVEALLQEPFFTKYKNVESAYKNHLIACAGTQHCPFGVIENKNDAIEFATFLEKEVALPDDARVRMYWSACPKGCGIHGLGDVGFEGCKAKLGSQSVSGVHIYLGGQLVGEGKEGYTVIKSAPIVHAKYYVAALMKEFKRLRTKHESFESFEQRILSSYSAAAIGFMMRLLAYAHVKGIDLQGFGFSQHVKTAKNEEFEVFEFGRKLYYLLSKEEPYSVVERFTNLLKEKPKPIAKILPDIDQNIAQIIDRAIYPDEAKRAVVFSELFEFVEI
jgi:ferredoxin-nitrite reductase